MVQNSKTHLNTIQNLKIQIRDIGTKIQDSEKHKFHYK